MSEKLRRNAQLIKVLHRSSPTVKKRLLREHCSPDFINCISECCKNVLKGNVRLSPSQKASLRRRHNTVRLLSLKSTSQKRKKKLIQSGGFLGALLGPIVSIISGLIGGAIGGK